MLGLGSRVMRKGPTVANPKNDLTNLAMDRDTDNRQMDTLPNMKCSPLDYAQNSIHHYHKG